MQSFIDKYCSLDAYGHALIDDDKLWEYVKYKGIMVLVSDKIENTQEAYFASIDVRLWSKTLKPLRLD